MKVKDLITNRSRWCKHYYAKDRQGNSVKPDSPFAARFCLWGGLMRCYPNDAARARARAKLQEVIGMPITHFNDAVAKFPDVRRALEKANV